jgi:hypothetical protein
VDGFIFLRQIVRAEAKKLKAQPFNPAACRR